MADLVTIPISFFELIADYQRPAIHLLINRGEVVQGIFDALKPWNPSIDDIETHTNGKYSEQGVTFKLPAKHISFFFGGAACRFVRDTVDWTSAEETIHILDTCLSALLRQGNIELINWKTSVGVHIHSAPNKTLRGYPQAVLDAEPGRSWGRSPSNDGCRSKMGKAPNNT